MQHALPLLIAPASEDAIVSATEKATTRQIQLGAQSLAYTLRRSKRRSIGLTIDECGLRAVAPRWASIAQIEAFIHYKQPWVLRHLSAVQERGSVTPIWQHGAQVPYLGRKITIVLTSGDAISLQAECLQVGLQGESSSAALRETVLSWLKVQALAYFLRRSMSMAKKMKVPLPSVGLSQARTQWGSCARKADGSVRVLLNWKLIHYEPHLIDYVIAHELAHVKHMNHSPAFWRVVGKIYPQYLEARLELRQRAHETPAL